MQVVLDAGEDLVTVVKLSGLGRLDTAAIYTQRHLVPVLLAKESDCSSVSALGKLNWKEPG